MKYLFGVAFLVLVYAVVGILTYPTENAASIGPVTATAVKAPKSFQMISVVVQPPIPATPPPAVRTTENAPTMIKEIQRRLANANCYVGAIDGVWSETTQGAARRFISGARGELWPERPDDALLALLRSRGDDKSLCSAQSPAMEEASSTDAIIQRGATPSTFEPPMGLGGLSSTTSSYRSIRGADSDFRHPLGTF